MNEYDTPIEMDDLSILTREEIKQIGEVLHAIQATYEIDPLFLTRGLADLWRKIDFYTYYDRCYRLGKVLVRTPRHSYKVKHHTRLINQKRMRIVQRKMGYE